MAEHGTPMGGGTKVRTKSLSLNSAARCEHAKPGTRCRCRCGGVAHGRAKLPKQADRDDYEALPVDDPHNTTRKQGTFRFPFPKPAPAAPAAEAQPEPEPEHGLLTVDEALAMLTDGDTVHTFLGSIGADWSRDAAERHLRAARKRMRSGPTATAMGHGLVAIDLAGGAVFFSTKRVPE